MGIWKKEVVKIDGEFFCYIENQDDLSGKITNGIRRIKYKNGKWTCLNMGQRLDLTDAVNNLQSQLETQKAALEWYRKTKF